VEFNIKPALTTELNEYLLIGAALYFRKRESTVNLFNLLSEKFFPKMISACSIENSSSKASDSSIFLSSGFKVESRSRTNSFTFSF
jgi:hypothetical protein